MPTHGPLFVALLIGTVLLVGLAELRAGAGARPGGRAPDAVEVSATMTYARLPSRCSTRRCSRPALCGVVRQAEPARAVAQPGDVRRLRRQHPHHAAVAAGAAAARARRRAGFILAVALWLWFTVLFANFAEALAEGRSKAQAASLRGLQQGDLGQEAGASRFHGAQVAARCRRRTCARATSCWSRPAT